MGHFNAPIYQVVLATNSIAKPTDEVEMYSKKLDTSVGLNDDRLNYLSVKTDFKLEIVY